MSTPSTSPVVRLLGLPDLDAVNASADATPVVPELHALRHIKTRIEVRVGGAEITVGELLAAREGQVLALEQALEHAVDILVEGQVVARGQLVAVDGQFAVRITERPHGL